MRGKLKQNLYNTPTVYEFKVYLEADLIFYIKIRFILSRKQLSTKCGDYTGMKKNIYPIQTR